MVFIAPGGRNLLFRRSGSEIITQVTEPTADQRYVPSVDAMFESASGAYGSKVLGVVLTGMGNDGARGTVTIREQGGQVLAEAEETSVVFGMPSYNFV